MKIEIWCQQSYKPDKKLRGFVAWSGELHQIPRVGEYVCLWDGWCSEHVLDVHYMLEEGKVIVEIRPDHTGEYREKADSK